MRFDSSLYLIFLAVAVTVFWLIPPRLRCIFVLLASAAFYATSSLFLISVPIAVAGLLYLFSRKIVAVPDNIKFWLRMGIGILVAQLLMFKYAGFLLQNVEQVVTAARHLNRIENVGVPLGISFFTFEAIGYLVDVRQKRIGRVSFIDLCIFMLFWPSVVAGPILRAREIVPQLRFRSNFEAHFIFGGLDRIIWGLVQKNVLANTLGVWVDRGFSTRAMTPSTVDSWLLAVAFSLQIYFDFAAYSSIAIGAARLLGITIPENFRQPYHAGTPAEFWSRWHMTLSRWVRDYLFFPISARYKRAALPLYLSLIGVMGLVGLWHGAGWTFAVWGLIHGILLALYRVYGSVAQSQAGPFTKVPREVWRVLTLVGVLAAWVPFRAPTLAKAFSFWSRMFMHFIAGTSYGMTAYLFTAAAVLFCIMEPWLTSKFSAPDLKVGTRGLSWGHIVLRPVAYCVGLLLFMIFDQHSAQFIYSKF